MRWTGLVIRDTMTRKRSALEYDAAKDFTEGARSARRLGRQFLSQSFRCSEGSFSSARTGKYFFFGPVRGCRNPLRAVGDDNDTLPPVFKAAGIVSDGNIAFPPGASRMGFTADGVDWADGIMCRCSPFSYGALSGQFAQFNGSHRCCSRLLPWLGIQQSQFS